MEKLVSGIQRQLETSGESEVQAQTIGEMVMEGLKGLDSVAYIRFASVYKDFREAKDFEDFVGSVKEVGGRSEEHTSELQSLMRISYAVFCLKKKNTTLFFLCN